ncbi:MAG: hypothetical protein AB7F35_16690 [Acetobacteraceae bacterium]
MADPVDWISQHQATLTWLGGGVATVAGGAWIVVRYLLERDKPASNKRADPPKPTGHSVSTGTGISSIGDTSIGGNVTIQHNRIPRGGIVLAVLGLLLLGYAFYNGGTRIDIKNGSYVGGSVSNSNIKVNGSNR